jgi:hypothetical protein
VKKYISHLNKNVTFGVKEDPRFEIEVFIEGLEEIYMY